MNEFLWLHRLVPRHRLLTREEAIARLDEVGATRENLPKIFLSDPAVQALDDDVKVGDVIEIERQGEVAGTNLVWRQVVEA